MSLETQLRESASRHLRDVASRKERHAKRAAIRRLENELKKRFDVAIRGTLQAVEGTFGPMWGVNSKERSPAQERMAKAYQDTRSRILNLINDQRRFLEQEVARLKESIQ